MFNKELKWEINRLKDELDYYRDLPKIRTYEVAFSNGDRLIVKSEDFVYESGGMRARFFNGYSRHTIALVNNFQSIQEQV